jgi:two-component sensor histidine kinase
LSLVDAMVEASDGLLLLLDGDLAIVAASDALCHAFDLASAEIIGKPIFAMGNGEWDLSRLRSLLTAVASGTTTSPYELFFESPSKRGRRCLEIHAQKINYDDPGAARLLVAMLDLTDTRAAEAETEKLIAEKMLLNRELQHRVANSLQIIASVLMQSASRVSSEEVRTHLHQAHSRVMSIAEVQRQLASTGADAVALRPYLAQLCSSIATSMIHDPERIKLAVEVDDSKVSSETSISLGLIVTELVINALKHAFPDSHRGTIKVDYAGEGADGSWMLEIADNGVGMPAPGDAPATAGLGTAIVEALVRQQRARLTIASGNPGTVVSIRFDPAGTQNADIRPLGRAA